MENKELGQALTVQDLIDFHQRGVDGCEAYALTDDPDKQTAKHYLKRSKWHRQAVDLLRGCMVPGFTAVDMATAAADGFRDGAKSVIVELPPRIERTSQNMLQEDVADMTAWNLCWGQCKAAIIAAGGSLK